MKQKKWNWQFEDLPHFVYDEEALEDLEHEFLHKAGMVTGAFKHINPSEKDTFLVNLLSDEAMKLKKSISVPGQNL